MPNLENHFITTNQPWHEGLVSVFAQEFNAENLKSATLAITALGVYEAQINSAKVGEQIFAPGYTYYPKNLHYQTYDVTKMLQSGANSLRVYLGQGWYSGRFTFDNKTQIYGEQAAVSWVLTIEDSDGSLRKYTSDMLAGNAADGVSGQVCLLESPYDYAGFYDGEIYYAEGAMQKEKVYTSKQSAAYSPIKYSGKLPEVFENYDVMVKLHEEITVKSATKKGDVTILDFGQNFSGMVEIDPAKMQGAVLKLRHGEILNQDGSLYTTNLRKAKAEIIYHKGSETKKYRPRFTYMGFRYIELSGVEYEDGMITAYAIYNDMERTGNFSCENPLVQKLYKNQIWGQKSNYVEVPTDCPQRDERMGYTGDGHVYALTGSYNFDTESFWDKFLKDIRYSQMDNSEGYVAPTIPALGPAGIGFMSMLGWGNAVTILPEMLYLQFGTDKYLATQYESMKLFVELEIRKTEETGLWLGASLGDWLTMGKGVEWMAMHNAPVSNSFIVNDLRILSETAKRMGKADDSARYAMHMERVRSAYIDAFIEDDGKMKDDYQGAYIMALKFVLPKGKLWDKVFTQLVQNIKQNGMQTGFFATEHILPLLADSGKAKLAYDLLLQENCPGWMYQIKQGATTMWERWDALQPDGKVNESKMSDDNMVSFNHYAFGSVGEFYYQYILGIKPLLPGYKKISIHPYVDERLGRVSGSYLSRMGLVHVAWEVCGSDVTLSIETPTDTEVHLPDGTVQLVQAGKHSYQCSFVDNH